MHPIMEAHLAKYASLMPSLALIYHLVDHERGPVGLDAAERAIAMCDYLEAHATRIFAPRITPDVTTAKLILEKVREGKVADPFLPRDVYRKGWTGLDKDDTKAAVDCLKEFGWVQVTGRKPGELMQVLPSPQHQELAAHPLRPYAPNAKPAGEGGSGGSAGEGGTGGAAGSGGSGGNTAIVSSFVREWESLLFLQGVTFCETGTPNCQVTDTIGSAALYLPSDQETSYTHEKDGYASYLRADVIPAGTSVVWPLMETDARSEAMYERLMSPYPMEGTGTIYVIVARDPQASDRFAGATFDLLGTEGKPYYLDEELNWSPDLTATTSFGVGGFVEVSPGVFEVEIGGTAENCLVVRGWHSDSQNAIRLPVREGFTTVARVDCD